MPSAHKLCVMYVHLAVLPLDALILEVESESETAKQVSSKQFIPATWQTFVLYSI